MDYVKHGRRTAVAHEQHSLLEIEHMTESNQRQSSQGSSQAPTMPKWARMRQQNFG
jgi:hypothetical protein